MIRDNLRKYFREGQKELVSLKEVYEKHRILREKSQEELEDTNLEEDLQNFNLIFNAMNTDLVTKFVAGSLVSNSYTQIKAQEKFKKKFLKMYAISISDCGNYSLVFGEGQIVFFNGNNEGNIVVKTNDEINELDDFALEEINFKKKELPTLIQDVVLEKKKEKVYIKEKLR